MSLVVYISTKLWLIIHIDDGGVDGVVSYQDDDVK